jgi:hypothetical protein
MKFDYFFIILASVGISAVFTILHSFREIYYQNRQYFKKTTWWKAFWSKDPFKE